MTTIKKDNQKENNNSKKLNDLDGKDWLRYSISVWDIVKTPEERKLHHPAMFPLELCERLIKIFTKKGSRADLCLWRNTVGYLEKNSRKKCYYCFRCGSGTRIGNLG